MNTHAHTYIYPPAPCGPPGYGGTVINQVSLHLSISPIWKLASLQPCNLYQYCKFTSLRPFSPFKASNLRSYSLCTAARRFDTFLLGFLQPPWMNTLPPTWVMLSTWGVPGYLWKIIKFQACCQDLPKSLKVYPRSPKVTKMWPKTIPRDTKSVNQWKSETTQKPQFLQWL